MYIFSSSGCERGSGERERERERERGRYLPEREGEKKNDEVVANSLISFERAKRESRPRVFFSGANPFPNPLLFLYLVPRFLCTYLLRYQISSVEVACGIFRVSVERERESARTTTTTTTTTKKAPHISFLPSHCTPRARSQTTPRFRDLASRGARESIESIAALGTAAHSLQARRRRTIEAALEASSSPFRTRVTEPFQMST